MFYSRSSNQSLRLCRLLLLLLFHDRHLFKVPELRPLRARLWDFGVWWHHHALKPNGRWERGISGGKRGIVSTLGCVTCVDWSEFKWEGHNYNQCSNCLHYQITSFSQKKKYEISIGKFTVLLIIVMFLKPACLAIVLLLLFYTTEQWRVLNAHILTPTRLLQMGMFLLIQIGSPSPTWTPKVLNTHQ